MDKYKGGSTISLVGKADVTIRENLAACPNIVISNSKTLLSVLKNIKHCSKIN